MHTYTYIYKNKNNSTTKATIQARHVLEALHNARFQVLSTGGDIRGLVISNH